MHLFLQFLVNLAAFSFGSSFYLISKVKDYKAMADANTNPNVKYSAKEFLNKEALNLVQLYLGGIAIILFLPKLIGGATVDIKNMDGSVLWNFTLKEVLTPIYFFIGFAGNSAIFSILGKYKKELLNPIGGNDTTTPNK